MFPLHRNISQQHFTSRISRQGISYNAAAFAPAGAIAPAGPDFEAAGPDFSEAAGPDFSEAAGPDFSEAVGPDFSEATEPNVKRCRVGPLHKDCLCRYKNRYRHMAMGPFAIDTTGQGTPPANCLCTFVRCLGSQEICHVGFLSNFVQSWWAQFPDLLILN